MALIETEFSVSFAPEALALTPMPDLRCYTYAQVHLGGSFPLQSTPKGDAAIFIHMQGWYHQETQVVQ